jgi:hypothetical protein
MQKTQRKPIKRCARRANLRRAHRTDIALTVMTTRVLVDAADNTINPPKNVILSRACARERPSWGRLKLGASIHRRCRHPCDGTRHLSCPRGRFMRSIDG